MKLNVGDLVELLYDGTTFSGVITAVTPERVELAFTLNIFVEGPGQVTWPNGANMAVDVGANALTKLHLRLPLEEVARIYASRPDPEPQAAKLRTPTRKAKTKDLMVEAGIPEAAAAAAPAPAPTFTPAPASASARAPAPASASASASASEPDDLEALLAEIGDVEDLLDIGGDLAAVADAVTAAGTDAEILAPAGAGARGDRTGIWVEFDALVDGVQLASGDLFPASLVLVSSTGCVVKAMTQLQVGERIQLKFTLGKDAFDLACTILHEEGPEMFEVAYDTLPSEVRVRMLRAVLGLAKPELRTQESWTYQMRRQK